MFTHKVSIHLSAETGLTLQSFATYVSKQSFNPPFGGDWFNFVRLHSIHYPIVVSIHLSAETGLTFTGNS